ncbi:unnamed protein product, partial [Didymodactylos carnosus]
LTDDDVREAHYLLIQFVKNYELLYGFEEMASVMHDLLHIACTVYLYGPLHGYSAFGFEDLNGAFVEAVHGMKLPSTQILNSFIWWQKWMWVHENEKSTKSTICEFINKTLNKSDNNSATELNGVRYGLHRLKNKQIQAYLLEYPRISVIAIM